jgi:hypothetical protein
MIYGGVIVSLPEQRPSILRFLRGYMADAPGDLGLRAALASAPPEESEHQAQRGASAELALEQRVAGWVIQQHS